MVMHKEIVGLDDFYSFKTMGKPYDAYVTALLALCKLIAPDALRIHSDGEPKEREKGLALIEKTTGRPIQATQNQDDCSMSFSRA